MRLDALKSKVERKMKRTKSRSPSAFAEPTRVVHQRPAMPSGQDVMRGPSAAIYRANTPGDWPDQRPEDLENAASQPLPRSMLWARYYEKDPPPPPPLAERPVRRPQSARATLFSSMGTNHPRYDGETWYRDAPAFFAPQPPSHREPPRFHCTRRPASARTSSSASDSERQRQPHPTQLRQTDKPQPPQQPQPTQTGRPQPQQEPQPTPTGRPQPPQPAPPAQPTQPAQPAQPTQTGIPQPAKSAQPPQTSRPPPPQPPLTATGKLVPQPRPPPSNDRPATIYAAYQRLQRKRPASARSAADPTLGLDPAFARKLAELRKRWKIRNGVPEARVDFVSKQLGGVFIPTTEAERKAEVWAPQRREGVHHLHRNTQFDAPREVIPRHPPQVWETTKLREWRAVQDALAVEEARPARPAGLSKREEEVRQNLDYAGFVFAGAQNRRRECEEPCEGDADKIAQKPKGVRRGPLVQYIKPNLQLHEKRTALRAHAPTFQ